MTEEIELTFSQGHFSWDDRKPTDVASILKHFLRFACVSVHVLHVYLCVCVGLHILCSDCVSMCIVCTCVCVCVRVWVYVLCACVRALFMRACYACVHVCLHVCIYMCVCMCLCCVCKHTHSH